MQHIKSLTEKLEKLNVERHDKYFSWIKTVLTIFAGLVAVLVSLKTKKSETETAHLFFTITIILLSTCILIGLLLLYEEVSSLDDLQKVVQQHILKSIREDKEEDLFEYINRKKIYKIASNFFSFLIILSFISLTIYGYLIDK
jgi:Na+/melibiose symporter-like transporter